VGHFVPWKVLALEAAFLAAIMLDFCMEADRLSVSQGGVSV
jgi:hypothetical protein